MAIELTPEELVLFCSGDEMIFTKVYRAYENEIYYFVFQKVKSEPDAHSLTAEVMYYLWRYRSGIQGNDHINNYLYITATHKSYTLLKKRRRSPELPEQPDGPDGDTPPDPLDIIEAKDAARFWDEQVIPVIKTLPGINGQVAQLYYVEKKSLEEIAAILELKPKNVSGHLEYAKLKLIERFKTLGTSVLAYLLWFAANLF